MRRVPLFLLWLLFSASVQANGGPSPSTWIGPATSANGNFNNATNWAAGVPANDGTAAVLFGDAPRTQVTLTGDLHLLSLTFTGNDYPYYSFDSDSPVTLTLQGGLTTSPTHWVGANFYSNISWSLPSAQTWSIEEVYDYIGIYGTVSAAQRLTKTGAGILTLGGNNTGAGGITGGITVAGGTLSLDSADALGSGELILHTGARLTNNSYSYNPLAIANALSFEDCAALGNPYGGVHGRDFTFSGTVTALDATSELKLGPDARVYFTGTLRGAGAADTTNLIFTGGGAAILTGATDATIHSLTADGAGLFFGTLSALPSAAGSIQSVNEGYVGMGSAFRAGDLDLTKRTTFFSLIKDKAGFEGTLGFDTDPGSETESVVHGAVDLSAFTDPGFFGLGTATHVTLDADADLNFGSGYDYKFGGGGGRLVLRSELVDSGDLHVRLLLHSPDDRPLTLVLQGENDFTGDVKVEHSFLILDSTNAFPFATNQKIHLAASGYVGFTENWRDHLEAQRTFADLLARIDTSDLSSTAVLGFDSAQPGTAPRTVSNPIDLTSLSALASLPYLGTTTHGLTLNGAFKLPAGKALRLAGLDGGTLIVASDLLADSEGGNVSSVILGHPDPEIGASGTVVLSGDNTYTGGTTLQSGTLQLTTSSVFDDGHTTQTAGNSRAIVSGPLGIGPLTVTADYSDMAWLQPGSHADIDLDNDLILDDGHLLIGESGENAGSLTFLGKVSGTGSLDLQGTVAFHGASTFTGNISIYNHALVAVDADTGLSSDYLYVSDSTVAFSTSEPVIGTLNGDDYSTLHLTAASPTLTIAQAGEGQFNGTITGTGVSLLKTGVGTLRLGANNTLGGDLTVNGGGLALKGNVTLANANAYLGRDDATFGTFTVAGTGAVWNTSGHLKVGYHGAGELSILEGGLANVADLFLAYESGSFGKVLVSGAGSTLSISHDLRLSDGGPSLFTVADGAVVNVAHETRVGATGLLRIGEGCLAGVLNTPSLLNNGIVLFDHSDNITFAAPITGTGLFTKTGSGTLTLSGTGNAFGTFILSAGTVKVAANGALGVNNITLAGGSLSVESGITVANPLVFANGSAKTVLRGNGTFGASGITIANGIGLAPGNSVGTLTFSNGLTWGEDGAYSVDLRDATGAAGVGYDTAIVTGTLTFNATIGHPFTISLKSLNSDGQNGHAAHFDPTLTYSWQIASASTLAGTLGINSDSLPVSTAAFTNAFSGSFFVTVDSSSVLLNYNPAAVPEPATWALLLTGLAVVGFVARRRRSR